MLYTAWGEAAMHRGTILDSRESWIAVHGHVRVCDVPGFMPNSS